jgi:hypothetical protein
MDNAKASREHLLIPADTMNAYQQLAQGLLHNHTPRPFPHFPYLPKNPTAPISHLIPPPFRSVFGHLQVTKLTVVLLSLSLSRPLLFDFDSLYPHPQPLSSNHYHPKLSYSHLCPPLFLAPPFTPNPLKITPSTHPNPST